MTYYDYYDDCKDDVGYFLKVLILGKEGREKPWPYCKLGHIDKA